MRQVARFMTDVLELVLKGKLNPTRGLAILAELEADMLDPDKATMEPVYLLQDYHRRSALVHHNEDGTFHKAPNRPIPHSVVEVPIRDGKRYTIDLSGYQDGQHRPALLLQKFKKDYARIRIATLPNGAAKQSPIDIV